MKFSFHIYCSRLCGWCSCVCVLSRSLKSFSLVWAHITHWAPLKIVCVCACLCVYGVWKCACCDDLGYSHTRLEIVFYFNIVVVNGLQWYSLMHLLLNIPPFFVCSCVCSCVGVFVCVCDVLQIHLNTQFCHRWNTNSGTPWRSQKTAHSLRFIYAKRSWCGKTL